MLDKLEKFIGVWRLLQLLSQTEMGVWILRQGTRIENSVY
jgi:hypothetical protein